MAKIKDVNELQTKLRKLGPNLVKLYAKALYEEALLIEATSIENTPMHFGALRASHEVSQPEVEGTPASGMSVSISITVGGPSAPYAAAVHEHLSDFSPYSWRIAEASGTGVKFQTGGPKFLENAVMARKNDLSQRIADRVSIEEAL